MFSQGFNNGLTAVTNARNLKAKEAEAKQLQQQKVIDNVNNAIDLNMKNVSPMIQQAVLNGTISDPAIQKEISTFVAPTIEMIKEAEAKGVTPLVSSQQFMAMIESQSRGQTQEQIQQNELNALREQETVKAEVQDEFKDSVVASVMTGAELGMQGADASSNYEVQKDQDGNVVGMKRLSAAPANKTNITVNNGNDKFVESLGKKLGEDVASMIDAGNQAVTTMQNVDQMANLLSSDTFDTGALQPLATSIQAVANDLGVDLEQTAASLGMDLGSLSDKQSFNRLSRQVVIDGFQKFKGNLNAKEVTIALESFASLGDSREANIDAIAALQASSEIARRRGIQAANINDQSQAKALRAEMFNEDVGEFKKLKEFYKGEMSDNDPTEKIPEGVPQGSKKQVVNGKTFYTTPNGDVLVID